MTELLGRIRLPKSILDGAGPAAHQLPTGSEAFRLSAFNLLLPDGREVSIQYVAAVALAQDEPVVISSDWDNEGFLIARMIRPLPQVTPPALAPAQTPAKKKEILLALGGDLAALLGLALIYMMDNDSRIYGFYLLWYVALAVLLGMLLAKLFRKRVPPPRVSSHRPAGTLAPVRFMVPVY
jgi:hypothetical protein